MKLMHRLLLWMRSNKLCRCCCLTCRYYDLCAAEIALEDLKEA